MYDPKCSDYLESIERYASCVAYHNALDTEVIEKIPLRLLSLAAFTVLTREEQVLHLTRWRNCYLAVLRIRGFL